IHIADKAYFDALNARFKGYDAVLYELVGPSMEDRGKEPPSKDGQNLAWVGQMQAMMKDALKLHGQLEGIDYQAKNFVHADMNMKQFTQTQETKKESFLTLYLKAVQAQKEANAKKGLDSDTAGLVMLLKVFTAKDSSTGLKRMIAQEFDSVEDIMAGVESGDGTVLVGERNRVALEVMDKQIAAGKKRLAIFYGAAHLADMEERLLKKGFKRTKIEWLKAWNLPHEE
ncbi:MAG: hypothetical protein Q8M07_15765, partial [Prosthecobacter sp.]|nr:hypothetical protein [Prosthecobacter sp.]